MTLNFQLLYSPSPRPPRIRGRLQSAAARRHPHRPLSIQRRRRRGRRWWSSPRRGPRGQPRPRRRHQHALDGGERGLRAQPVHQ